jgi:hypothetical protein
MPASSAAILACNLLGILIAFAILHGAARVGEKDSRAASEGGAISSPTRSRSSR